MRWIHAKVFTNYLGQDVLNFVMAGNSRPCIEGGRDGATRNAELLHGVRNRSHEGAARGPVASYRERFFMKIRSCGPQGFLPVDFQRFS